MELHRCIMVSEIITSYVYDYAGRRYIIECKKCGARNIAFNLEKNHFCINKECENHKNNSNERRINQNQLRL